MPSFKGKHWQCDGLVRNYSFINVLRTGFEIYTDHRLCQKYTPISVY